MFQPLHKKVLSVTSAEDLKKKLALMKSSSIWPASLQILSGDPHLMVRSFQLTDVAPKDLHSRLTMDAIELLSLPANKIALDYQCRREKNLEGVLICLPRKILDGYTATLAQAGVSSAELSARSLIFIDQFMQHEEKSKERSCVIEFDRGRDVYLGVIARQRCELLRVFSSDKPEEIQEEIIRSLRSLLAKSRNKNLRRIIATGEIPHKDAILAAVGRAVHAEVEEVPVPKETSPEMKFFKLNLLRKYFISSAVFQRLHQGALVACGAVLCLNLFFLWRVAQNSQTVASLKNSYRHADYLEALKLQEQLKE